jgi:acetone carboxylase gamma subunit
VYVPAALRSLGAKVHHMTAEQQQISRIHYPSESHENRRVQEQSCRHHWADNDGIFTEVRQSCNWYSIVGDWSPEMCAEFDKKESE